LCSTRIFSSAESLSAIRQGFDEAMSYAQKSVALDPDLSEAYAARGFVRGSTSTDWEGSRADYAQALKLNPCDAESHRRFSRLLATMGKLAEAIDEARKATEIDPLSALSWSSLGRLYYSSGQLKRGRAALEKSLRIVPAQDYAARHPAIICLLEKKPAEALEMIERSTVEWFRLEGKALALHDLGGAAEAQQVLDRMIAHYAHAAAFQIAEVHAWFGEIDKAFEWLERARAQREDRLTRLKYSPLLQRLRHDPRYAALQTKMNLQPDYG
jgi:tetratricopeptide (TPR) repeat protein